MTGTGPQSQDLTKEVKQTLYSQQPTKLQSKCTKLKLQEESKKAPGGGGGGLLHKNCL